MKRLATILNRLIRLCKASQFRYKNTCLSEPDYCGHLSNLSARKIILMREAIPTKIIQGCRVDLKTWCPSHFLQFSSITGTFVWHTCHQMKVQLQKGGKNKNYCQQRVSTAMRIFYNLKSHQ